MDDEELIALDDRRADLGSIGEGDGIDVQHAAKVAGRVAASAVIATSLAAALTEPPRADLMVLPEPTPIVQVYSPYVDDIEPAEENEDDESSSRWRRVLKLLRALAVALLVAGTIVFGALKGCAGCTAGLLLAPDDPPEQEQQQG